MVKKKREFWKKAISLCSYIHKCMYTQIFKNMYILEIKKTVMKDFSGQDGKEGECCVHLPPPPITSKLQVNYRATALRTT